MLSLCDFKYHCRTCLIKIESFGDKENAKKYVSIAKYPEVEQIIRMCLRNDEDGAITVGQQRLDEYMPNLCCICLAKWQDFSTHYHLAVKNNEILGKIIKKEEESFENVPSEYEEPTKVFLHAETSDDACEIEKYETISPFYPTSRSNTPLPDPQSVEALNESQFSDSHDVDNTEAIQLQNAITSDSEEEEVLLIDLKEMQKKKSLKNPQVKRTRSFRSKRESNLDQTSETISDKHLNYSNENSTKKLAYRCEPCKKFFYGSITYEGHIKRVHEGVKKAYQCKECEKAYSFPHNLAEHIAASHRKLTADETLQTLQCEHCNKPYKNKASLAQHMRNHHQDESPESKRIICDQCGFLAAHQMSLAQHIKNKHTEVEEIKCEQCSKLFKSQYYLKYHILSFHNPMNIKPFKCPQCPMAFTRRPRLNIHIRTHLNYSERIKCDFEGCDVRFVKLSAKRRHMRLVHLKVKQHVCDICGEAFGIKATLRHHRYIHTGEKPYNCNVCGQAFRQVTAMKTHRKMHANKEKVLTTTSTESDILSSLTQIDGGFEDSSNGFV